MPEGFYDRPGLRAALAGCEFGPVFRAVRAQTGWSQQSLGEFLDLTQGRVSDIETGKKALLDLRVVVPLANKLRIPAGMLGFTHGVTVEAGTTTSRKDSWVQRRNFVQEVAGLTLATGVAGLDLGRLAALVPEAEPTGTRHLGAGDVEVIEQATAAYTRQDFAAGSGPIRDLAVAHLRSVLPLLDARIAPELRPRFMLATAELALITGYMSFDVTDHDAARRLWMIGLGLARATEDPGGRDLAVYLLYDMASQAVYLGRPDEALRLVHLGQAAAVGAHPVSAATTICLTGTQARAHAAQGDVAGCDRALGQAEEHFAALDPASTPGWVAHVGDAVLSGYQGRAYHSLAIAGRDPRAAGRAVPLLRHAVDQLGLDHARARALYLPDLAGVHALAGDLDTAVTTGHQAVDAVTAVHSSRAYDRLRVLNTVLEPVHTSPGVAELRERLRTAAA